MAKIHRHVFENPGSMLEMEEGLEEIKKSVDSNGKLNDKIAAMEARILDKVALMETMISN